MKIIGGELFKHLLEKIISLDLLPLNVTFHFVAQFEILTRSLFSYAAVIAGSSGKVLVSIQWNPHMYVGVPAPPLSPAPRGQLHSKLGGGGDCGILKQ